MSNINETASQSITKVGSLPASITNTKSQIGSDFPKSSINPSFFPFVSSNYINEVEENKKKVKQKDIKTDTSAENEQHENPPSQSKKDSFQSW